MTISFGTNTFLNHLEDPDTCFFMLGELESLTWSIWSCLLSSSCRCIVQYQSFFGVFVSLSNIFFLLIWYHCVSLMNSKFQGHDPQLVAVRVTLRGVTTECGIHSSSMNISLTSIMSHKVMSVFVFVELYLLNAFNVPHSSI